MQCISRRQGCIYHAHPAPSTLAVRPWASAVDIGQPRGEVPILRGVWHVQVPRNMRPEDEDSVNPRSRYLRVEGVKSGGIATQLSGFLPVRYAVYARRVAYREGWHLQG